MTNELFRELIYKGGIKNFFSLIKNDYNYLFAIINKLCENEFFLYN